MTSPLHCARFSASNGITLRRFGLPLPLGLASQAEDIQLLLNDAPLLCSIEVSSRWHDNSIKWIQCATHAVDQGEVTLNVNANADCNLQNTIKQSIEWDDSCLFHDPLSPFRFELSVQLQNHSQHIPLRLTEVTKTDNEAYADFQGSGSFEVDNKCINVEFSLIINKVDGQHYFDIRVHNPSPAAHEGSTWDLGDANSVYIEKLCLTLVNENANSALLDLEHDGTQQQHTVNTSGRSITLAQYGSGGENWDSPVHWNEHKQSTVIQQGFELTDDNGELLAKGLRAAPIVRIDTTDQQFSLILQDFWQNFPATLTLEPTQACFELFPQLTELQGGESKTWSFLISPTNVLESQQFSACRSRLPLTRVLPEYLNKCGVLPHILFDQTNSFLPENIHAAARGEHSFFAKREVIDEYGWRNYGDLYADHETTEAKDDAIFVSHYNNQYDPIFGLTYQYIESGEDKFLDLSSALNRHVQDIDIYDTDGDKPEFNGGLMWHTDHYLRAETCTHRSNSKHHQYAYDGFLGGGGPGGQHGYTTGLCLQYQLFGDKQAAKKVTQLCNWIRCFYNGGETLLHRTFRYLTIDLKTNTETNIGIKEHGYRYPLDRGTGNFVVALLDSYELDGNQDLLDEAAMVIKNTTHPLEDLSTRHLGNVEISWFYTVFLQSVIRFLFTKESAKQIDEDYWYARDCLINFGEWMLEHESFYLDKPDELEFPNDTWCAQEIRKANVLFHCYCFGSSRNDRFLERANEFFTYIHDRLSKSDERYFTRIQALIMQNQGVYQQFCLQQHKRQDFYSNVEYQSQDWPPVPVFSRIGLTLEYIKDMFKLLPKLSISKEIHWLKVRLGRL